MSSRSSLASWQTLAGLASDIKQQHLVDLFANDAQRFERFSTQIDGVFFDYSKNLITQDVKNALLALANDVDLASWRDKMFSGEKINITENRAVLHTALRKRNNQAVYVDGENVVDAVNAELNKISAFTEKVRSGAWLGYTGKRITDVVSIGVGGSNLGPQMATEALAAYADETLKVHYASNADGMQIANVLSKVNAETTLFIISSKTFTTSETMANAKTAVAWLKQAAGNDDAVAKHFAAVSTNLEKTSEFGINPDNVFTMWDWVGGRFSMWSAIGLPIALYLGFDAFIELLEGAFDVDKHFVETNFENNIPVLMALLSVWNTSFLDARAQAILPYDQSMHMLPAYLQQAEMESNGKSVTFDGKAIDYRSVPLIWGMTGINGQHAFYQYLHQGTTIVPADFIGSIKPVREVNNHHEILMANFFAQTEAMMTGVSKAQVEKELASKGLSEARIAELVEHKVHQGNRPTTSILLDTIDAKHLGRLIALYEHKIFCQGIILEICSFDQWGVELGKGLANAIQKELETDEQLTHDSSTAGLIALYKNKRKN
ncbi:glucose-6-phosphate isomerase [Pseudoalteromonas sp. MMG024]|uniref:glucose-6-phosphate isomerase n=1 Tax=Pseudoalteromonas sp. MMG024 TaxID=2909980 RepID=UPI001EFFD4D9|nr:glucose-6-phosphate isomerase [Pseudoalteromonas sp. MMG024]MCF6455279.1 glucose-6-phosphate isomerase [Pseudoalteromonas sp. MMG024]